MTEFYYCSECERVLRSSEAVLETRVARYGAWGCGDPSCERCYEDRVVPLAWCPVCDNPITQVDDADADLSILDYLQDV